VEISSALGQKKAASPEGLEGLVGWGRPPRRDKGRKTAFPRAQLAKAKVTRVDREGRFGGGRGGGRLAGRGRGPGGGQEGRTRRAGDRSVYV
jgi:hypothetical protein